MTTTEYQDTQQRSALLEILTWAEADTPGATRVATQDLQEAYTHLPQTTTAVTHVLGNIREVAGTNHSLNDNPTVNGAAIIKILTSVRAIMQWMADHPHQAALAEQQLDDFATSIKVQCQDFRDRTVPDNNKAALAAANFSPDLPTVHGISTAVSPTLFDISVWAKRRITRTALHAQDEPTGYDPEAHYRDLTTLTWATSLLQAITKMEADHAR